MDKIIGKHTPLVTIGIPVYNAEKFLDTALKSVLSQTYTNFELIITDDGSTDNSVNCVKKFSDPRIILLSDGENHGISYRLNQQISLAKGKYFIRMDADDIMFIDRVEKQVAFLENNPDVDVTGSSAVIIDDENRIIGLRDSSPPQTYEDGLKAGAFIHPTVAGKTAWFSRFRYKEDLVGAEDFDLWLRSQNTSVFKALNEPLLFYRDPLKFKLNTYLFRLKQQRKIFRTDQYLHDKPMLKLKTLLGSYVKSVLARLICFLGLDNRYIAMRNNQSSRNNIDFTRFQKELDTFA